MKPLARIAIAAAVGVACVVPSPAAALGPVAPAAVIGDTNQNVFTVPYREGPGEPGVATTGAGSLVVWAHKEYGTPPRIVGQRLAPGGQRLGHNFEIARAHAWSSELAAAPDGADHLVAWDEPEAIRAQALAADGSPTGGPVTLAEIPADARRRLGGIAHDSTRGRYLVTWDGENGIPRGRFVRAGGAPDGEPFELPISGRTLAYDARSDSYAVGGLGGSVRVLDGEGRERAGSGGDLAGGSYTPALAANPLTGGFVAVSTTSSGEARAHRIDANGDQVGAPVPLGSGLFDLRIVHGDGGFLVVAKDGRGMRLDGEGRPISGLAYLDRGCRGFKTTGVAWDANRREFTLTGLGFGGYPSMDFETAAVLSTRVADASPEATEPPSCRDVYAPRLAKVSFRDGWIHFATDTGTPRLEIRLRHKQAGRRVGGACRRLTRANRRRGPFCVHLGRTRKLTTEVLAQDRAVALTRFGRLPGGAYRATIVAIGARAARSQPRTIDFAIR